MRLLFWVGLLCPFLLFAQPIIHIGVSNYGPPFEIAADDEAHFSGFEIDLMEEICRRAKFECVYKRYSFPELFNETLANRIDLAIGAISITPERQKDFLFSLPYLPGGGQYVTKISSPIKTIEDINGKRIGIEEGTVFKAWIMSQFGDDEKILEYRNSSDVLQALYEGKVDVVLLDIGIVQYWVTNNANVFRPVGKPISSGYGVMANRNQVELINTVNKYLLELEDDGTYLKLYENYF
ncbi:transporter substrate-binding domain-containing protein [Legionella cardiaca]|uniref:Transporter substrate-binding domain-containing protein n=1 Tax=Legionella cardiaca TaxID=1071983 RepID=A0ABY8APY6_9GAMM|nr:transporter substrate-binding domain-containing protein [Legionella cardiaca]WED41836.1 transporter substrate-binding domain-containing protein [Legionella cardiaca]